MARVVLDGLFEQQRFTSRKETRHLSLTFGLTLISLLHAGCGEPASSTDASDEAIQLVYAGKMTVPQAQTSCRCLLELVPIGGTVFHFGLDLSQSPPVSYPFQSTFAGAGIAEAPITRLLKIRSDANGKWAFNAIKVRGTPLRISFVYEFAGYATTKSQLFEVGDAGITDLAIQFSTEAYYTAAKGQIEQQIGELARRPVCADERRRHDRRKVVGLDVLAHASSR